MKTLYQFNLMLEINLDINNEEIIKYFILNYKITQYLNDATIVKDRNIESENTIYEIIHQKTNYIKIMYNELTNEI